MAVPLAELRFIDVLPHHWFYNYVMTVVNRGLFLGTTDTTFSPSANMTGGMFVTVLARLGDVDLTRYQAVSQTFNDVTPAAWYFSAVEWAVRNGIVTGADDNFVARADVTREQMATMIYRFANAMNINLPTGEANTFADQAYISSWAADAVGAVSAAGIIRGNPNGTFNPHATALRAEVAAVFTRFINVM